MAGTETPRLPFDVEFQKSLVRLICEDPGFAHVILDHLQPQYFDNEVLAWAVSYCKRHHEQYGGSPSLHAILQQTRRMDSRLQPVYAATIEQIKYSSLKDEQWMRDATLDFAKRNIFVATYQESRHLYNQGKVEQAYDLMMERMEQITKTTWEPVDGDFFFESLPRRHGRRLSTDPSTDTVSTGLMWLDNILGGGLSLGEMGLWIGYQKGGKSAMLLTMGLGATRFSLKNVAHFVFEGMRKQVEDRYDAAFMGEFYRKVKFGDVDAQRYQQAWQEYQMLGRRLWVEGFTQDWNYSILDITESLKRLKRDHDWRPQLIIIDYGDLIRGREKSYPNETEKQKAAFRDMKKLAERGYGMWTASQAQRAKEGAEDNAHFIYGRQTADCIDKVRVVDFYGSVNATRAEKQARVARLLAEEYRDNEAGQELLVRADFGKMMIREEPNLVSPSMPSVQPSPSLGYYQRKAFH